MSKSINIDFKAATAQRIVRTEAYAEKIRKMFAQTVNEILSINKTMPILDEGVMYSFDAESAAKQNKVESLLRNLHAAATLAIQNGIKLEWDIANHECDKIVSSAFGKKVLESSKFSAWTDRNSAAMTSFMNRTENGMKLSDRVWKSVQQLREEMEVALTVSIGEGSSASSMSRKVREYLNNPDDMFRRFRYKKGEKEVVNTDTGEITKQPVYAKKWKKRIHTDDGKYKWIDYDRKSYKTGNGVYKSSAKNAMRVTRTETNIAYRRADNTRWQSMDFVLGQRVQLSRNHPKKDICDELQGDYPKNFIFDGWHPQCFCFVTPILCDESEMQKVTQAFLKGKKYTPKGNEITDYPDNFKSWVKDNESNIMSARDKGTEPYFLRNNSSDVDAILNQKPKTLSVAEKAAIRHDARTAEQSEAIKAAWKQRQHTNAVINKAAGNIIKVAGDYGEVDYSKLQQLVGEGKSLKIKAETKNVAQAILAAKKDELLLSKIIPDAHQWHKTFTSEQLHAVYDAVEKKMSSWSGLDDDALAKKLTFEAIDFLGGNMNGVQAKYSTWKVSQAAYLKQLDGVNMKIAVSAANSKLYAVKDWLQTHPKSAWLKSLVTEADNAIAAADDIAAINNKVSIAEKEYKRRLADKANREAKKAAKNNSGAFGADAYTAQRKNNALWANDTQEADDELRADCGKVWNAASDEEKDAIYAYTHTYNNINEPLRGLTYYGPSTSKSQGLKRIPLVEKIINRSVLKRDMWVQRGDGMVALKKFGLSNYYNASDADIMALVGKDGVEGAFWYAGVAKGKGMYGELTFNIYMPKGSKAMYCEPFSAFGNGDKRAWDGISNQATFGSESEILIQRGTKFRVTKAQKSGGHWYIDLEIIEQQPVKFPYVGGYPFL